MNGEDLVLLSLRLGKEKIRSVLGFESKARPNFQRDRHISPITGRKDTARSKMANPQTVLTERGPIKADLDQVKRGDKVTVI